MKVLGNKTFIVAEAGLNHNGNMNTAKLMIIVAKNAGADAIKFQTYKTETRVPKNSPIFNILKKCELTDEQTKELAKFAKERGIIFFSTPFDIPSVDLLAKLKVPLLKIASFDIVNLKLIKHIAKTGIPVILSRGMANTAEIDKAIKIFKKYKTQYALLHCVSAYPTKEEDANLNIIRTMTKKYDCPIGYSDHTLGIEVPLLAVMAGASIIEKHFTLDKDMVGPDHKISCNPIELKKLVMTTRAIEEILGDGDIRLLNCERGTLQFRRKSK